MALRKPKRAPRRIKFLDWRPDFEVFFGMATETWARPKHVKVIVAAQRSTWEARFVAEDGAIWRLRTRLMHRADGSADILEQHMAVSYSVRGKGREVQTVLVEP